MKHTVKVPPYKEQATVMPSADKVLEEVDRAPLFKSSAFQVADDIEAFLKKCTLGMAYNIYCVDCRTPRATHFIVWSGTFVCKNCYAEHRQMNGNSMRECYAKDLFSNDHWDDYQLKSLQLGGNKPMFDLMKDYGVAELSLKPKY